MASLSTFYNAFDRTLDELRAIDVAFLAAWIYWPDSIPYGTFVIQELALSASPATCEIP